MFNDTLKALIQVTHLLLLGTHLGLLHVLWMLVSGALLPARGALFAGLKSTGLSDEAIRRAWRAFREGKWQIRTLLAGWREVAAKQYTWQAHEVERYQAIAVDVSAFWRPRLKQCPSVHYHPSTQRALPAVIMGMAGTVGDSHGQRLALLEQIVRVQPRDGSETGLWTALLKQVRRTYNHTVTPATSPDQTADWQLDQRTIRVDIWRNWVLPKTRPHPTPHTFDVYAFHAPNFKQPWLLATSVKLTFQSVYALYADCWAIEHVPLAAKQMLGAHRQFVHAPESVQRLPELALLAASILSFLAPTAPPLPTGFWDRQPKPTLGRFRRALLGQPFPKFAPIPTISPKAF